MGDLQRRISVIIPALNEEAGIAETLEKIQASDTGCQVIVVDGGSTDATVKIARDCGATVLETEKGRAKQQVGRGVMLSPPALSPQLHTIHVAHITVSHHTEYLRADVDRVTPS